MEYRIPNRHILIARHQKPHPPLTSNPLAISYLHLTKEDHHHEPNLRIGSMFLSQAKATR